MYHIALISKHNKEKTYLQSQYGVKATWVTEADARHQLECLNVTASYFGFFKSTPVNFDWVIEPTPDTMESVVSLQQQVYKEAKKYTHQRRGQALMNALFTVNRKLYDDITGTDADCFYVDAKIENFTEALSKV